MTTRPLFVSFFYPIFMILTLAMSSFGYGATCPPGDIDGDCKVDLDDLMIMAQQWLWADCIGEECADINGAGGVNLADFAIISEHWLEEGTTLVISEFLAINESGMTDREGDSSDWLEIHNISSAPISLWGWYVTDDPAAPTKWALPNITLQADSYQYIWASGKNRYGGIFAPGDNHTNFILPAEGIYLALVRPSGMVAYEYAPQFPQQLTDTSYGIGPDGTVQYMTTPTPGAANVAGAQGYISPVSISLEHGFYSTAQAVTLSCPSPGAQIRYTTSGTAPTATTGTVYTGPIPVNRTTTLRAAAFQAGYLSSRVNTRTYIFLDDIVNSNNPYFYPEGSHPAGWPDTAWGTQVVDYGLDNALLNSTDPDFGGQTYRQLLDDALLAIPTICFSADPIDFLNTSTIHQPCSVELLDPNGTAGFQINAGLRIRGGVSAGGGNPKHGWRIFFSDIFDGPLEYPLFGEEGASWFKKIDLRCDQNKSWHFVNGTDAAIFINDVFGRSLQREMGQPYNRGRFYHLYVNGLYWGLYGTEERADDDYGATYFGGDAEDYDALKSSSGTILANSGTTAAYDNLWTEASQGFSGAVGSANYNRYNRLQGLNPDGSRNLAYPRYLDVDNLVCYMFDTWWMYNIDGPIAATNNGLNNLFIIYNRNNPDGFKFFQHDIENAFSSGSYNSDYTGSTTIGSQPQHSNPRWLHQQLVAHPEYKMQFADLVQKHFYNEGIFVNDRARALFNYHKNELNLAIIGESVRWGDYGKTPGRTRQTWLSATNAYNTWFNVRTGNVINQFKNRGWFPQTAAPALNQFGGQVAPGFMASMTAPAGQIWYTLNGSDPHLAGGAVSPSAIGYNAADPPFTLTLLAEDAARKAYVPTADPGTNWRTQYIYTDTSWLSGNGGVGFDRDTTVNYLPYIAINVESDMYNKMSTCDVRAKFTLDPAYIGRITSLTLKIRYDDGFVMWLNGTEVVSRNKPATLAWNSAASGSRSDATCLEFETIDLTSQISRLAGGNNLLAIQAMNQSNGSSDVLNSFVLECFVTGATTAGTPFAINENTQVKARAINASEWSPLTDAIFCVGPIKESLRVSEIMYRPLDPPAGDPNAEFIELKNTGTQLINLKGVKFTNGIDFTFPALNLNPGQYIVAVKNQAAFQAVYGTGITLAGVYTGSLENNGEKLTLVDPKGQTIQSFTFNNWYGNTDGGGFSLNLVDPANSNLASWSIKESWRPSSVYGGTPGANDAGTLPAPGAVVINEVLAHAHAGQPDWIELYNTTSQPVNIGGWFLSDSDADDAAIKKYRIADGTSIPSHGYLVFQQDLHFGNTDDLGCLTPFALSENGEKVVLNSASGATLTGYRVTEDFGASETGVSLGRYLTSTGSFNFVALSAATPNNANASPLVGPIVISEINYYPPGGGYEYLELKNITTAAVALESLDNNSGLMIPWQFTDGIDFVFPAGTIIPAGGVLVVANIAPASFRATYPSVPAGITVLGPFANGTNLANSGERVQIGKPGDVDSLEIRQYIRVDRVTYSDGAHPESPGGTDPWPTSPDGGGTSLQRKVLANYGNDVANWQAGGPNPGM